MTIASVLNHDLVTFPQGSREDQPLYLCNFKEIIRGIFIQIPHYLINAECNEIGPLLAKSDCLQPEFPAPLFDGGEVNMSCYVLLSGILIRVLHNLMFVIAKQGTPVSVLTVIVPGRVTIIYCQNKSFCEYLINGLSP